MWGDEWEMYVISVFCFLGRFIGLYVVRQVLLFFVYRSGNRLGEVIMVGSSQGQCDFEVLEFFIFKVGKGREYLVREIVGGFWGLGICVFFV